MKYGRLFVSGLLILLFGTGMLSADERTFNIEAKVIDSFDGPGSSTYGDGTAIDWKVIGSKFATEGYPKMVYVPNTWPEDLFGNSPENKEQLQVLGVNTQFDRMGFNQVEIVPGRSNNGEWVAEPIELPGRVSILDLWFWGSNFDYKLEAHFMDYRGISYRLSLLTSGLTGNPGTVKFAGWKNLYVEIPSFIKQSVNYKPEKRGLRLTKLVLFTEPTEKVTNYYMYLDQLKVLTDMHETYYDGYDLTDEQKIKEIWGGE